MSISNTVYSPYATGQLVASGYSETIATESLKAGRYVIISSTSGNIFCFVDSTTNVTTNLIPEIVTSGTSMLSLPEDRTVKITVAALTSPADTPTIVQGQLSTGGVGFPVVYDGTNYQITVGQTNAGRILYSTNLITWEGKDIGSAFSVSTTYGGWKTFVYNANVTNKYVWCMATTGTTGAVWTSTDSVTWTSRNLAGTVSGPFAVTINENATNKYVLMNRSNTSNPISYSTDGVTWTNVTFSLPNLPFDGATNGTASTNQIYVYGVQFSSTPVVTSTDAITWTARSIGITTSIVRVIWFNSKYWAFPASSSNSRKIANSTDGVTWTTVDLPFNTTISASAVRAASVFIYDNKLWVASMASLMVSTDGTTWDLGVGSMGTATQIVYKDSTRYWGITNNASSPVVVESPFTYMIYAVDTTRTFS